MTTKQFIVAAISGFLFEPSQAAINFELAPVFRLDTLIDSKSTWMEKEGLATCKIIADEIFVFSCAKTDTDIQEEEIGGDDANDEENPWIIDEDEALLIDEEGDEDGPIEKLQRLSYADTDSVIDLENCISNCDNPLDETDTSEFAFQMSEDLFDSELVENI